MSPAEPVAVIVPTLRRPEGLTRALQSLFAQTGVADRLREIVVVDNDPAGTAAATVEALREQSPWPLVCCHAPVPGVATARNVGLQATDAPLIAFLDDDEVAAPDWLAQLLAAQVDTGADVVFGPIRGRAPDAADWLKPYLEDFFGRAGPASTRLIAQPFGCGNSLMVRRTALPGSAPFDVGADQAGGEDDALFAALADRGGRFGWAAGAWVDEIAPAHRATLGYALSRAFAFGQGPSQTAAARLVRRGALDADRGRADDAVGLRRGALSDRAQPAPGLGPGPDGARTGKTVLDEGSGAALLWRARSGPAGRGSALTAPISRSGGPGNRARDRSSD